MQFVAKRDKDKLFRFSWLQSDLGKEIQLRYGFDISKQDSVILKIEEDLYQKSDAVLEIMKRLPGQWRYLSFFRFVPKFIRDRLYNFVAKNRYRCFGRKVSCQIPTAEPQERFI